MDYEGSTAGCKTCDRGEYTTQTASTSSAQCEKCPKGKSGNGAEFGVPDCTDCPAGRYALVTGRADCHPCHQGSFMNSDDAKSGTAVCKNCPLGKYGP